MSKPYRRHHFLQTERARVVDYLSSLRKSFRECTFYGGIDQHTRKGELYLWLELGGVSWRQPIPEDIAREGGMPTPFSSSEEGHRTQNNARCWGWPPPTFFSCCRMNQTTGTDATSTPLTCAAKGAGFGD